MTKAGQFNIAAVSDLELTVHVWRTDGVDQEAGHLQTFKVMGRSDWSVINALQAIQRDVEPDLAFYIACKLGLCTACWAMVNGKKVLTCTAPVEAEMTIEPARGYRVLRDVFIEPIDR